MGLRGEGGSGGTKGDKDGGVMRGWPGEQREDVAWEMQAQMRGRRKDGRAAAASGRGKEHEIGEWKIKDSGLQKKMAGRNKWVGGRQGGQ